MLAIAATWRAARASYGKRRLSQSYNALEDAFGIMAAPIWTEADLEAHLGPEVLAFTDAELRSKLRDIQNETSQLDQEAKRVQININKKKTEIADNARKIEMSKQLPYLVGNIVEVIETPEDPDEAEDGAFQDRFASDCSISHSLS
jgi:hypothetical protein